MIKRHASVAYAEKGVYMNNFEFYSPTCFVFGKETENKAGAYVKRFGGTKVLIHYGGGSKGTIGGFLTLDTEACTQIYRMML